MQYLQDNEIDFAYNHFTAKNMADLVKGEALGISADFYETTSNTVFTAKIDAYGNMQQLICTYNQLAYCTEAHYMIFKPENMYMQAAYTIQYTAFDW
jgi:hypothetical protein